MTFCVNARIVEMTLLLSFNMLIISYKNVHHENATIALK